MTLATNQQDATITVTHNNHTAHFHVAGRLNEQGAADMKEQFEKLSLNSMHEVVFNFHDITYIGSAGMGKLLLFYKKLSTQNIKMRVDCPAGTIRNLMMELKLDSLFTIG